MVIAITEPAWLHTAGQAAGTVLLVELFVALFIILALMVVLAYGVWWVKSKVIPILREYAPKVEQIMSTTQQGTDRVVQGVAEFFGRRQQIETGIRVLLFGPGAAVRVREDALVHASNDLELMAPAQEGPGPENGWTPQPRPIGREVYSAADGAGPATLRPRIAPPENGQRRQTGDGSEGNGNVAGNAS